MSEIKIIKNKVFRSGDSWVVSLPVKWRNKNGIKLGDELVMIESPSGKEMVISRYHSPRETEDER